MDTPVVPVFGQVVYRDNFEKGYAFEEFITKLFNERSFQVKQWLKAGKRPDHLPWADLTNPDLQMELVFTGARKYRLAVECKWRRECIDGMIKWAEVPQIYNYERFQRETGVPVIVAIGIGGEAHDPERL